MKNFRILFAVTALIALASCGRNATVSGTFGQVPGGVLTVRSLGASAITPSDTVKIDKSGHFKYSLSLEEGQPEFVHFYYSGRPVASLLVSKGDHITVTGDTLGRYEVSGSQESSQLKEVSDKYAAFKSGFDALVAADKGNEAAKLYIDHYRECVKYIMANPRSLTVIPVLYEQVDDNNPVFAQPTDALHFRNAFDSLVTVYPDSRYVKALGKVAEARQREFELSNRVGAAFEAGYPDIEMPSIKGNRVSVSSLDAPVVLVVFWNAADAESKLINTEVLMPVWDACHARGLDIYSIGISANKAEWATTVLGQKLPWTNVNDGLGTSSPTIYTYAVEGLPSVYLIAEGELKGKVDADRTAILAAVRKYLK